MTKVLADKGELNTPGRLAYVRFELRGFSLIEVAVGLVLVAILLGLAIPTSLGYLTRRRLENTAFLLLSDLRLAQQSASGQAGEGPWVEICFRSGGYDIYRVRFASIAERAGAVADEVVKRVQAGREYSDQVQIAVNTRLVCLIDIRGIALGFRGSGVPYPGGALVQMTSNGQARIIEIDAGTGLAKVLSP